MSLLGLWPNRFNLCSAKIGLSLILLAAAIYDAGGAEGSMDPVRTRGGCVCKASWATGTAVYSVPNNCVDPSGAGFTWCFTQIADPPCIGATNSPDWDYCDPPPAAAPLPRLSIGGIAKGQETAPGQHRANAESNATLSHVAIKQQPQFLHPNVDRAVNAPQIADVVSSTVSQSTKSQLLNGFAAGEVTPPVVGSGSTPSVKSKPLLDSVGAESIKNRAKAQAQTMAAQARDADEPAILRRKPTHKPPVVGQREGTLRSAGRAVPLQSLAFRAGERADPNRQRGAAPPSECSCVHGSCLASPGRPCSCDNGRFIGTLCDKCAPGFNGPDCQINDPYQQYMSYFVGLLSVVSVLVLAWLCGVSCPFSRSRSTATHSKPQKEFHFDADVLLGRRGSGAEAAAKAVPSHKRLQPKRRQVVAPSFIEDAAPPATSPMPPLGGWLPGSSATPMSKGEGLFASDAGLTPPLAHVAPWSAELGSLDSGCAGDNDDDLSSSLNEFGEFELEHDTDASSITSSLPDSDRQYSNKGTSSYA